MSVIPLHTPKWEPDSHLIDAAISGRVRSTDLDPSDRAWLVAHLTHRGYDNNLIAGWLRCSVRTIQTARTEPVAVLTTRLLQAEAAAEKATAKARASQITPAALAQLLADIDHLKTQRGNLIDQLDKMRRACGEPCPDAVIVVRPTGRPPRRPRHPNLTLPLFPLGE
ncbi:hypothetical protein [Nocardia carnea]|uniref:hypothetical protein n=1 Tax=Nocardia carnea TaxID=37328 RepID=UPI0024565C08|nr:hypothetical protein [Nocardia carnea]